MPMMTIIFGTTLQTLGGDPFQNVNGFLHQVNQGDPPVVQHQPASVAELIQI